VNNKIFVTLFVSLFASITGVGIVIPLLPVYANNIGANGIYISLIFGAFSMSRTLFLPYFGRLSDLKGRKPFIISGLIGYTLVSIAFIFAQDIYSIISIRFIQGIASAMIMPVILAYVGDLTPKGKEGYYMGIFHLSVFGSLSIGPVVGGLINDYFDLKTTFIFMGFFSFISFLLSFFLLPATKFEKKLNKNNTKIKIKYRDIFNYKDFTGLFVYRFSYTIIIGIIWSFLPVYADTKFNLSSSEIGVMLMLGVFFNGILQTPIGYLADKINKTILIGVGSIVMIFALISYEKASGFSTLFMASTLLGIGGGIAVPAVSALSVIIGDRTKSMGTVISLLTTAHSLGMLIGSLGAGFIMELIGLSFAFKIGIWVIIFGSIFCLLCLKSNKNILFISPKNCIN